MCSNSNRAINDFLAYVPWLPPIKEEMEENEEEGKDEGLVSYSLEFGEEALSPP